MAAVGARAFRSFHTGKAAQLGLTCPITTSQSAQTLSSVPRAPLASCAQSLHRCIKKTVLMSIWRPMAADGQAHCSWRTINSAALPQAACPRANCRLTARLCRLRSGGEHVKFRFPMMYPMMYNFCFSIARNCLAGSRWRCRGLCCSAAASLGVREAPSVPLCSPVSNGSGLMSGAAQDPAGSRAVAASKVPTQGSSSLPQASEESLAPTRPAKGAGKGARAGRVGAGPARRVQVHYLGRGAATARPHAFASGAAASPTTPRQTDTVTGVEKGGSAERQDWVHQASGRGQVCSAALRWALVHLSAHLPPVDPLAISPAAAGWPVAVRARRCTAAGL